MTGIKNKTVLITGASSGIGEACAYSFAKEGARLILTARRLALLENIAGEIKEKYSVEVLPLQLDVRDKIEVNRKLSRLPAEWSAVDILINNAGLAKGMETVYEADLDNWDTMIDTNVKGLLYVSHAIIPGMIERGGGHVINLGSTAGHMSYKGASVYCATKFGVRAISDSMRLELLDKNIRITSVDPGAVETDFSNVRFDGDTEKAKKIYEGMKPLTAEDIAETIIFCASRPSHVNINELIITPSVQANSLVIHREKE
ncbi:MAG: SDR family oxidoreductase [Melioribacteraceae bacterium]|nr:SDR family oxidoreductase [Melioribacteraceae bacterium]